MEKDDFHWDFDLDFQLVVHACHDDPGHRRLPLSDTGGGKIHGRATGGRLCELPGADKKDHPDDLLIYDVHNKRRRETCCHAQLPLVWLFLEFGICCRIAGTKPRSSW